MDNGLRVLAAEAAQEPLRWWQRLRVLRSRAGPPNCAEFAMFWLTAYPRSALSTRRTYGFAVRRFAADFDGRRLDAVNVGEAAMWARKHRWALPAVKAMYSDAVRAGFVSIDPFAQLRSPKSRGRSALTPLRPGDIAQLEDAALDALGVCGGMPMRAMITLAAWCGVRPGELLALTWDDVGEDTLTIRQSLSQTGTIVAPKSGRARMIAYPRRAQDAVTALPRHSITDRVFSQPGRPLSYWSFLRDWTKVREFAGRQQMHFYELRHFCASQLLARGIGPKVVALQLGHRDGGRLVLNTYGHLYPELALDQLRAALDADGY